MLWKCCTQYASKFGKLSSGHRTGKGQFSFQSQRKAKLKNAQATAQLHSSPSQASTVREPWTSRCSSWIYKRQSNQRSNCQHPLDHWKSIEFQKNIYFCFTDYNKLLTVWITIIYTLPEKVVCYTCLLRNLYTDQEAIVRTKHEAIDWFQIGKVVRQECTLSPWLFNLYAESIMQNAGLDEA